MCIRDRYCFASGGSESLIVDAIFFGRRLFIPVILVVSLLLRLSHRCSTTVLAAWMNDHWSVGYGPELLRSCWDDSSCDTVYVVVYISTDVRRCKSGLEACPIRSVYEPSFRSAYNALWQSRCNRHRKVVALTKKSGIPFTTDHKHFHGARPGLQIERLIAEKVQLSTLKYMLSSVFKKASVLFTKRSSALNPALFVLRQPQVGLWGLKSPIKSNGNGSYSIRSCRSSVRHSESGKYKHR